MYLYLHTHPHIHTYTYNIHTYFILYFYIHIHPWVCMWPHLLLCFYTSHFPFFLLHLCGLPDVLFYLPLLRKLPWLSRQSDRLLTDRSLVRSQAEAPFLLFPNPYIYETRQKSTPPVGLEPTTARLRAARSTDWARKATDDIPNMSLFYQYCPHHVRNTHSSWHLVIYTSRHLHIWMCAYHHLIYHTPTDCPLPLSPTQPLPLTQTLSHAATLLLSTRLVPYLQSNLLSISSSLYSPFPAFYFPIPVIFCLPLILFSYLSLGSFRGSVGRAIGC